MAKLRPRPFSELQRQYEIGEGRTLYRWNSFFTAAVIIEI